MAQAYRLPTGGRIDRTKPISTRFNGHVVIGNEQIRGNCADDGDGLVRLDAAGHFQGLAENRAHGV
jgi:hypothetical protein